MDERLKLAEAYYAVAQDLQDHGRQMLETANMLGTMADRICEASMRAKQPGCTRSHPHENMSAECERLTEVAKGAHSASTDGS